MVRITAGRRRYVINFTAMIQLNEETSNRRPITLWLKSKAGEVPAAATPAATAAASVPTVDEIPWPIPEPRPLTVTGEDGFQQRPFPGMGEEYDLLWGSQEYTSDLEGTKTGEEPAGGTDGDTQSEKTKTPRLKGLDLAQKKQVVE